MSETVRPTGDIDQRNTGGINIANTGVVGTIVIGDIRQPREETPWMAPAPTGPVIERPAVARALREALTAPDSDVIAVTTALEGAGGFGKTTLAAHLCLSDERLKDRFAGGLLWITLGQHVAGAELANKINGLCELLTGQPATVSDPELAGARLGMLLEQRQDMMLVIDDVWSAAQLRPFLIGARRCRRLVTTRNSAVLPRTARSVLVDAMEHGEAVLTLTNGLGGMSPAIVGRLLELTGRWPLLLSLVNAAIREQQRQGAAVEQAGDWVARRLAADGPAGLDLGDAESRETAVAASVRASLDLLSPSERERYFDLSVFPEDVDIPADILALLWAATGSLERGAADRLRDKLISMRLAIGSWHLGGPALRMHDVFRSYLRHHQGATELAGRHRCLLDAARSLPGPLPRTATDPTPWWLLPDEADYLWRYLGHHLAESGQRAELAALVRDPRWLLARVERYGPVAVGADLALADDAFAGQLRRAIGQAAHLLVPLEPSLADTLLSRLHGTAAGDHVAACARSVLAEAHLTPVWPLPDQPDPALYRTLEGHTSSVRGCAASPDGRWIASTGFDSTIRIWAVDSGSVHATLRGHLGWVWDCAIAPDGTWLASAGDDGTMRIWDLATGALQRTLETQCAVTHCAIAPDGSWLASTGTDGTTRIWDAHTGTQRALLQGHHGATTGCAIAPDGTWLASTGTDGTTRIWDAHTGTQRALLQGHHGAATGCAIAPDGTWLASTGTDGTTRIWDAASATERAILTGHADAVTCCAIAPDGTWLASAGADRTVRIWDTRTAALEATLLGDTGGANSCAVSPDGTWLASASSDTMVRIWHRQHGVSTNHEAASTGREADARSCVTTVSMRGIATSPDGTRIVTANTDGTVGLWNVPTASYASFPGHTGWGRSAAVAPDGAYFVSGGVDGLIHLWDERSQEPRATLTGHTGWVNRCAFPPDGTWLASASSDGTVRLWDMPSGQLRNVIGGDLGELFGCAIAPDGTWLVSTGTDQLIRIWDTATGTALATLAGHTGRVSDCGISSNGEWLVTASFDRTMRIWNTHTAEERAVLAGETGPIWGCAISPDNQRIASVSTNGTIRIWNPHTATCETALRVEQPVRDCTWLDNSKLCVAGNAGLYLLAYDTQ
ncbi:hypothetical protein KGA66_22440 [Actinocrinis puniceicyclus]|uniref:NB-ARC domain-containing protein n=1 Tax=Actinocrinis puniceicyclus TaxID=977794 RepID=A0A8J8BD49_9ACTN|nr:NB-ARC domain-containing protein [Actinocrinis puniceicyclus]MBS2965827.1 hypothetical protein [Actinocrinis puniceicyclus]